MREPVCTFVLPYCIASDIIWQPSCDHTLKPCAAVCSAKASLPKTIIVNGSEIDEVLCEAISTFQSLS